MVLDPEKIKKDFPILNRKIHGKPLVYLDNAATTQKPLAVIEAIHHYYLNENSNIHRGVHTLSEQATLAYEGAREKIRAFIGAKETSEIIFVRGATEGINLIAQTYGRKFIGSGDEIVISTLEHHSNIVPWQILCEQVGAKLRVIPINDKGELLIEDLKKIINAKTKLMGITHVSNALGTIVPLKEIIKIAHEQNIPVVVDGAQAIPHLKVNVQELDADFYLFSGHKVYGPTGIGVVYGKKNFLEIMPPYQGGGDMISSVTFEKTEYNILPFKFEAGTPHIAGAIGLGVALDYLKTLDLEKVALYENELLSYALEKSSEMADLQIIGQSVDRAGVISFNLAQLHAHDVGTVLDRHGIAIRAGHHCAMPLMKRLGLEATCRVSFAVYNTKEDVDSLFKALQKTLEVLG
ncbi:MAG: cysteine sulfinate desulfinase [Elusimicrobia bacterium RIFCSPLOWO2_02_FULL_39_32]|nr:MAG: cysteine sulfinate desulfinase [Elusimicrobia bacterium RIFCSPHIGHO2_02_FULL_39_36]OGR91424.1 MAG: cysteine sulfinate desulfinase [Elusimicrobia bacterium RIFCSPLOWO2_02_FULL_39_32]OGR98539.1 MAG: cysteine sulfinate desulfinase [Elusimicrobia bacterium RIFCSPLOWO2_12_FULL_39_28]